MLSHSQPERGARFFSVSSDSPLKANLDMGMITRIFLSGSILPRGQLYFPNEIVLRFAGNTRRRVVHLLS